MFNVYLKICKSFFKRCPFCRFEFNQTTHFCVFQSVLSCNVITSCRFLKLKRSLEKLHIQLALRLWKNKSFEKIHHIHSLRLSWSAVLNIVCKLALRKHAYSNILKISSPNTEHFLIKTSDIFHISAQNIDCGYSLEPPRRGGSNEYPQSMFLSRNKKNNVYPCKPQFYYIKVGFKGVKII